MRFARHYMRLFFLEIKNVGVRSAYRKAASKVRSFVIRRLSITNLHHGISSPIDPPYLPDMVSRGDIPTNLVMIISNTQIDQCISYRINQKISIFKAMGVTAKIFSPLEIGRIKSFLPFTSIILIYRTEVREDLIKPLKAAHSRLIFEFDDLVVGSEQVQQSGVRAALTEIQYANLLKESSLLKETAIKCDEIIVSTEYLKEKYCDKSLENTLSKMPIHVVNNFLIKEHFYSPEDKLIDFAFTSPSQSIGPELKMANDFLQAFDKKTKERWKLLVIGNQMAYEFFVSNNYSFGDIEFEQYAEYSDYVNLMRATRYVLIPISDISFNQSKTVIRSFDALLAGAAPLVSPVGDYRNFLNVPEMKKLVVKNNDWNALAESIDELNSNYNEIVKNAQKYTQKNFGMDAAIKTYKRVFEK